MAAGVCVCGSVCVPIRTVTRQVITSNGTPDKPDVRLCRLPDIQRKVGLHARQTGAGVAAQEAASGL